MTTAACCWYLTLYVGYVADPMQLPNRFDSQAACQRAGREWLDQSDGPFRRFTCGQISTNKTWRPLK